MIDSEVIRKVLDLLGDGTALIDVAKVYCEQECCTPVEVTLSYAQKCLYEAQECLSTIDD